MNTDKKISDVELRALRDRVFEKPISDKEWENCRDNWRKDVAWLITQAERQVQLSTCNLQPLT